MRVRDDIHTQRYTQTLSVLRGNILSVSTELCLSHTMVTTSSHQCTSQSPSLSFSHYSQASLYPNIGLFLPMTAPCTAGMLCVGVYLSKVTHKLTHNVPWTASPALQRCRKGQNDIRVCATDIIQQVLCVTLNVSTCVTLQNNTLQPIEPFTILTVARKATLES